MAMGQVHPNAALLERFYEAFVRRDWQAMAACYHPEATFTDPVFDLKGPKVAAMWRMLCERGTDLRVEHRDPRADDRQGAAHWEARYTFSATGRSVHNVVDASFEFRDGAILRHQDRFDFWRWSRQALGPVALLLGWTPMLRRAFAKKAGKMLDEFASSRSDGAG